MQEVPSNGLGQQSAIEQFEAKSMSTLTILAKVNIHFDMTSSNFEIHQVRRMVVIGVSHEKLNAGFNLLARVTCETPESARDLYNRWKHLPPEVQSAWHTLCS
jgi:hypothetical protein